MSQKLSSYTETLLNDTTFEMISIEGGTFPMGGESGYDDSKPIHKVELNNYYLGRSPVTQGLWEAVMGENENPSEFIHPLRPVEQVSWYDAVLFCNRLSEQTGRKPYYEIDQDQKDPNNKNEDDDQKWLVRIIEGANGYRLPTEAEWEYAARGGKYAQTLEYAGSNNLHEVAWQGGNSHNISQPTALKRPNALGLYDMSGNVWEWCQDWFDDDYYQRCADEGITKNPPGPIEGSSRVVRGGSWINNYGNDFCAAYRDILIPFNRFINRGFRLSRY